MHICKVNRNYLVKGNFILLKNIQNKVNIKKKISPECNDFTDAFDRLNSSCLKISERKIVRDIYIINGHKRKQVKLYDFLKDFMEKIMLGNKLISWTLINWNESYSPVILFDYFVILKKKNLFKCFFYSDMASDIYFRFD